MVGIGITAAQATPMIIDFNSLSHGQIVDNEFTPSHGVTFSADNVNTTTDDHAVAFETDVDHGEDPDLRGPNTGNSTPPDWDAGNLQGTWLGNALIIQEVPGNGNSTTCTATSCTPPDDEGRRPAGSIFINFEFDITSFGFDLIDVEGAEEYTTDNVTNDPTSGFFAAFFTSGGTEIGRIGFGDFSGVDLDGPGGLGAVAFGNNSANRIAPIVIANLGGAFSTARSVEISLGGSGAIDTIVYTRVPEPGTLGLVALGLAGIGLFARRRRRTG